MVEGVGIGKRGGSKIMFNNSILKENRIFLDYKKRIRIIYLKLFYKIKIMMFICNYFC